MDLPSGLTFSKEEVIKFLLQNSKEFGIDLNLGNYFGYQPIRLFYRNQDLDFEEVFMEFLKCDVEITEHTFSGPGIARKEKAVAIGKVDHHY